MKANVELSSHVALVVLAAGRGERFGGVAKAMLNLGGTSFLARIVEVAAISEVVVVVAEPFQQVVAEHAEELGCQVVVNPYPEHGMGSSVAVGFSHLVETSTAEAALLWPVDIPGVASTTISTMKTYTDRGRIVVPTFSSRGGHPVLVGAELWPDLTQAGHTAQGARGVFHQHQAVLSRIAVNDPGILRDVDRPRDLFTLKSD